MYALCVSGAVNTQGFVWKFLCAIQKFSFIHITMEFLCSAIGIIILHFKLHNIFS